jgi:hypothetical protein
MFGTLMKNGGYRVDYLNLQSVGTPEAFAFYVYGALNDRLRMDRETKHQLYSGLNVIRKENIHTHLVGVYIDIVTTRRDRRPAFCQMKVDLRDGMFKRVFTFLSDAVMESGAAMSELQKLQDEVEGFELVRMEESRLLVGAHGRWADRWAV